MPSSRRISEIVRQELRAAGVRRVVEVGTGTGTLSQGILAALPAEERLLCIERDPVFCAYLRRRLGRRALVVEADALSLGFVLKGTRWERPEAVICSIPLLEDSARAICRVIADVLAPGGLYLQVANFRKPIERHFRIDKTYSFWLNLPPERLHRAYPLLRRT
jgi:phosphatidylethanolamine/phosphatidyl-N-methylethanolamine N-methyltransferase